MVWFCKDNFLLPDNGREAPLRGGRAIVTVIGKPANVGLGLIEDGKDEVTSVICEILSEGLRACR